jgi:plasmid stabilization system protein ParE
MDYQVILATEALGDLEDIVCHIARHDNDAARRLGDQLLDLAEALTTFPNRGRIVPELGRRDWREVIYRSFRIIYRVNEAKRQIQVSRFWHASRGFPVIPFES